MLATNLSGFKMGLDKSVRKNDCACVTYSNRGTVSEYELEKQSMCTAQISGAFDLI